MTTLLWPDDADALVTDGLWTVLVTPPTYEWPQAWVSLLPPCVQAQHPDNHFAAPVPKLAELLDASYRREFEGFRWREDGVGRVVEGSVPDDVVTREHEAWQRQYAQRTAQAAALCAGGLAGTDGDKATHCDECERLVRLHPNRY